MKYLKLFCVILCISFMLIACEKECAHQYQSQVTLQASCTQEGKETFTCKLCQHSYTQLIPVLEHSYGPAEIEKAATCAEEGIQSSRCTVCGTQQAAEKIAKTDTHVFTNTVVREASCSEEGLQSICCTVCGVTESTPIEKIPHILENITVTKESNCTQEGQCYGDCTVCGAHEVAGTIATNDVHVFTNTVIREATCTDAGEGTNTCQLCQYSEPCQYELKDHTYSIQNVLTKVSCTQNGEIEYTCADCGYSTKKTVAASGHKWTGATCKTAGVCSVCGATGSKANHAYVVLEDLKPTETFAGYRVKKCSTCEKQISEYYTKYHTFDLDAIAAEIAAYAEEKGFKPIIEKFYDYDKKTAYSVLDADRYGYGPSQLVKSAKKLIDNTYSSLTANGAILGNRALHIHVYYSQSGAIGSGFFGVYTKTSFYNPE